MKQIKICYPAVFHPEEDGSYSVVVPDMEKINCGCSTFGETLEEAYKMAFEAVGLCLEDIIEKETPIPTPSKPEDIEKKGSDFVVPIMFDMVKYLSVNRSKSIKKTLTIPEWLNDMAVENKINFSQVLQNALKQQLGII